MVYMHVGNVAFAMIHLCMSGGTARMLKKIGILYTLKRKIVVPFTSKIFLLRWFKNEGCKKNKYIY